MVIVFNVGIGLYLVSKKHNESEALLIVLSPKNYKQKLQRHPL
jgi:phosphoribosylaminoimidazole (AIR) synthetase